MRAMTAFALLSLALVGCESKRPEAPAQPPPPPPPSSVGTGGVLSGDSSVATTWQVVTLAGAPVAVPDSIAPTLKLPAATGKAGGMSGCNRWFAGAIRSGEALSFAPVGATKMACAGPAMDVERQWFAALGRVRRASERDGILVLADSAGTELATLRRQ